MTRTVTTTCPCGTTLPVHRDGSGNFAIRDVECPDCLRRATGGNVRTGEIFSWIDEATAWESEQEFERQQMLVDDRLWGD